MTTFRLTEDTRQALHCAATIGFFDGVHLGHVYVIDQLRRYAQARGLRSALITFDRHPRQVIDDSWQPQQLSTLEQKEELLRLRGVDYLVVLPFGEQMAQLSAYAFMRDVLGAQLGVEMLLTGYDNRFGHRAVGSSEGFEDYVRYGKELGIEVVCGQPLMMDGQAVSSSRIRRLLAEGRVDEAALCLGRPYGLQGQVVSGEHVGRQMGFPTANLSTLGQMSPGSGVYAVKVALAGEKTLYQGVTNIGKRPTFGVHQTTVETYILDFHRQIYGEQITLLFIKRLRDEQLFDSPDALARQMTTDVSHARMILNENL